MCKIDYKEIRKNLLEDLTLGELSCLCGIIQKNTNLPVIHKKIKEALNPETAKDPEFCRRLQEKVDKKQFIMYELMQFSQALANGEISLFENPEE